jgi:hypothetical protein
MSSRRGAILSFAHVPIRKGLTPEPSRHLRRMAKRETPVMRRVLALLRHNNTDLLSSASRGLLSSSFCAGAALQIPSE